MAELAQITYSCHVRLHVSCWLLLRVRMHATSAHGPRPHDVRPACRRSIHGALPLPCDGATRVRNARQHVNDVGGLMYFDLWHEFAT